MRLTIVVCLVFLGGCSGASTKKAGKPKATKGSTEQSAAATDSAPAVEPNSGLDLDGKRVRAFSPAGWRRAPKSYDYLVRYQFNPQLAYPSVIVLAADPPEGFATVTSENHEAFADAVAKRLAEEFGGDGKPALRRKPAAATVGAHHAVTWSAPGEAKLDNILKPIERECTAVVIDGRLYTVEAWAPVGKLDNKAKAAARAVAAALAVPSLDPVEPLVPFGSEPAAAPEPDSKPAEAAKPSDSDAKP
jgi:hypothetical protein